ncbi:MAG: AAA family ATPase [Thermodesulfobacteriota bacterium]|nr:AAA family ATPase [Thermodesulfobacteriota bacterium]
MLKGVRRCGKSTLMAQVIHHLLSIETRPASILVVRPNK